jgi:hypothetical protein
VYQCWWRICLETNVSPRSNITCFTFHINLCPIYCLSIVQKEFITRCHGSK